MLQFKILLDCCVFQSAFMCVKTVLDHCVFQSAFMCAKAGQNKQNSTHHVEYFDVNRVMNYYVKCIPYKRVM